MQKSLVERDRQVIWHPYTQAQLAPDPLPVTRGQGVYLEDAAGNRYIDAISSWWVNLHGHAHPYLASRIYEQAMQLEQVIFAGFTHEPAVQLAERLLQVLPGDMSKVFYTDNGSTAVEVALKMAIQYWQNIGARPARKKILAFTNSYHGDTFGSMSVSGRGPFTLAFDDYLFEVLFIDPPTSNFQPPTLPWEEIACIIYEPLVQGAGGMLMHSPEGLNALLKHCKAHNIICIADEVMTGFGRTGKLFASNYMQEKPHIICLSKGITGGMMALGATACTQKIFEAFLSEDRMKTLFHGHSYTANPLACAAGNASLDLLLADDCLQSIEKISASASLGISASLDTSASLDKGLSSLKSVRNLRSLGTILAFEVETSGKAGYLNNISATIHKAALQKGVLIRPLGNTVYIMPPYCITEEELKKVYDCLAEVVEEVEG
jgi:adenosylmethionine---8-amino-7-oxononanoate aminotransferase